MNEVSPDDLGLDDVPARFDDLVVDASEVAVDVDEFDPVADRDLTDAEDLTEARDEALDVARQALDDMALGQTSVEYARNHVLGAMRAEYLRRQFAGLSGGV